MTTAATKAAGLAAQIATPWGGALLRLIADPLEAADPAALPAALPGGAAARLLATPALRGRLARAVCDMSPDAVQALIGLPEAPRARLALVPAAEAAALMALGTAWALAPQIGTLIRLAEVRRAREALGEAAYTFAMRRAPMMPGIAPPLAAAIGLDDPMGELARLEGLRPGAALFGLAAGPLPEAALARLRLRRPAAAWAAAAAHARPDPQADAAFAALRRLLRDSAPPWSSWLS